MAARARNRTGIDEDAARAETAARVERFHQPDHAVLRAEIERVKAKHGVAVGQDLVKELQAEIDKVRSAAPAKKSK